MNPFPATTPEGRWLLVCALSDDWHTPSNHVRAALITGQQCNPVGVAWLIEMLRGQHSDLARSVLERLREDGQIPRPEAA